MFSVSSWLHSAICLLGLDVPLLQIFVGGVLVAMVLHLGQVTLFRGQHGVNLSHARSQNMDAVG